MYVYCYIVIGINILEHDVLTLGLLVQIIELKLFTRLEEDIINFELYSNKWPQFLLQILSKLPRIIRIRPVAKCGIRSYSVNSTDPMEKFINESFHLNSSNNSGNNTSYSTRKSPYQIGLFVYIFIIPSYRKLQLSDFLLNLAKSECKLRGDNLMLLIHDDNGSGKLIQYYLDRNFKLVNDNIVPKGMLTLL